MSAFDTVIALWDFSHELTLCIEAARYDSDYHSKRDRLQAQIADIEAHMTRITGIVAISDMDTLEWCYQQPEWVSQSA